jgi:hypothetical protein|tara:strand:+ start:1011 stop:1307 length:297 start_codon:yes stop_codon:yes gene_type:complete
MKLIKLFFGLLFLILLNGCIQTASLLGPSMTIAATGNVYQAGLQYGVNNAIKKETGKDAFELLKDATDYSKKDKKVKIKYTELIKKKFIYIRQKLTSN